MTDEERCKVKVDLHIFKLLSVTKYITSDYIYEFMRKNNINIDFIIKYLISASDKELIFEYFEGDESKQLCMNYKSEDVKKILSKVIHHNKLEFIIYNENKVNLKIIYSNEDLTDIARRNPNEKLNFYHVQNSKSIPVPSIFQNNSLETQEDKIILSLIQRIPNAFMDNYKYIDILTKIHSENGPTRLLEFNKNFITVLNDLIINDKNSHGREIIKLQVDQKDIKTSQSDTVSLLSTLSILNANDKYEMVNLIEAARKYPEIKKILYKTPLMKKYIGEIEKKISKFEEEIIYSDIFKSVMVAPLLNNNIIAERNSYFLLPGLFTDGTNRSAGYPNDLNAIMKFKVLNDIDDLREKDENNKVNIYYLPNHYINTKLKYFLRQFIDSEGDINA